MISVPNPDRPDFNPSPFSLHYPNLGELSAMLRRHGFTVTGFDVDQSKTGRINAGTSYIPDVAEGELAAVVGAGRLRATSEMSELGAMDVMHLHSPTSAILSAIIFNAIIIPALIPVALKGVKYRAIGAGALLQRNLMIYGLGGIIIPFIGIKAIDLAVAALHLA